MAQIEEKLALSHCYDNVKKQHKLGKFRTWQRKISLTLVHLRFWGTKCTADGGINLQRDISFLHSSCLFYCLTCFGVRFSQTFTSAVPQGRVQKDSPKIWTQLPPNQHFLPTDQFSGENCPSAGTRAECFRKARKLLLILILIASAHQQHQRTRTVSASAR